jgi:hypothetical protein
MDSGNYRAMRALRAALSREGAERLALVAGPNLRRPTLRVRYGSSESVLAPVWAGEGYPADVERAVAQLTKNPLDRRETLVVAARRLSTGARARLAADGTSWVDEDGRASISADPGLIVIRDASPAKHRASTAEMRWSEGVGAVAEYLLALASANGHRASDPPRDLPSVAGIADEVGVSGPLVSRAMRLFDSAAWTAKVGPARGTGSGRILTDATGFLSSWAAWHAEGAAETVHTHATFRDPEAFVREHLREPWGRERWALTGWLALERRAAFMTAIPLLTAYLDREVFGDPAELDSWIARAGLRRVDTGARVDLVQADPYLLRRTTLEAGIPQVSDIRLYGDLLRLGARGPDAAEHLRETRIGF